MPLIVAAHLANAVLAFVIPMVLGMTLMLLTAVLVRLVFPVATGATAQPTPALPVAVIYLIVKLQVLVIPGNTKTLVLPVSALVPLSVMVTPLAPPVLANPAVPILTIV